MERDLVVQRLRDHRDAITGFGVASLAVFGSTARDTARPDSDVDILAEFVGPATFDGYMGLKFYLEDLLGARVDLVTPRALRPEIRSDVEREAVRVT